MPGREPQRHGRHGPPRRDLARSHRPRLVDLPYPYPYPSRSRYPYPTATPNPNQGETLSTLRFAASAKRLSVRPQRRSDPLQALLADLTLTLTQALPLTLTPTLTKT